MVGHRWLATLAALACLVAAGCSEADTDPPDDAPSTSEPTSPSESGTPEGPAKPEMPDIATKPTRAGAIAFVRHYWAMVDHAGASGDLKELRELSSPSCETCAGGTKGLSEMHKAGGHLQADSARVRNVRGDVTNLQQGTRTQKAAHLKYTLILPPSEEFYGKGDSRNKKWPGGRSNGRMLLYWQADHQRWLVMDWKVL